MPEAPQPDNLATELDDIKRRLKALETAPRFTNTAQVGGSYALQPEDGSPPNLWVFGEFTGGDGGKFFGSSAYDVNGQIIMATSENIRGNLVPWDHAQFTNQVAQGVTAGTFQVVYVASFFNLTNDLIYTNFGLTVPGGVTAEVRLGNSATSEYTNTVAVPASSSGNIYCQWQHPFKIGWGVHDTAPTYQGQIEVQVRVASGAGTISVFPPRGLIYANSYILHPTVPPLQFA